MTFGERSRFQSSSRDCDCSAAPAVEAARWPLAEVGRVASLGAPQHRLDHAHEIGVFLRGAFQELLTTASLEPARGEEEPLVLPGGRASARDYANRRSGPRERWREGVKSRRKHLGRS